MMSRESIHDVLRVHTCLGKTWMMSRESKGSVKGVHA